MHRKTALVTGSSRGIGKACAFRLSALGYHIFLNCSSSFRDLEGVRDEILTFGGSADCFCGDVGDPSFVRDMFSQIHNSTPALDILVNNAGISHFGLLSDMSDAQWNQILSANLSSVFYCCRSAIPPMVTRKSGRIINISSIWGNEGASCEAAYSATKSGINGLTRALAKELAPSHIQVNALACGVIDTQMNSHLSEEEHALLRDSIPYGRYGTPQEVGDMIAAIINAPYYLTGQVIGFHGGF